MAFSLYRARCLPPIRSLPDGIAVTGKWRKQASIIIGLADYFRKACSSRRLPSWRRRSTWTTRLTKSLPIRRVRRKVGRNRQVLGRHECRQKLESVDQVLLEEASKAGDTLIEADGARKTICVSQ